MHHFLDNQSATEKIELYVWGEVDDVLQHVVATLNFLSIQQPCTFEDRLQERPQRRMELSRATCSVNLAVEHMSQLEGRLAPVARA